MKLLNRQNGETIVEVLISMAVLGLVLSSAYALANRSTQANRQSQERAEALNENSARLEMFKTYLEDEGDIPAGTFCVYQNNDSELKTTSGGFVGGIPDDADEDQLNNYPNQCKSGTDSRYHTAISKDGDTFTVTTRWFRANGGGVDQLAIEYKAYESSELVWDDDFDPSPEPIVLPPTCSVNQYFDAQVYAAGGDACRPCPGAFTSPGGDVTVCTLTANGRGFSSCTTSYCKTDDTDYPKAVYTFSGGHENPFENDARIRYDVAPHKVPPGTYDLQLNYYNAKGGDSNNPPPNYSYEIRVEYSLANAEDPDETTSNKTVNLPIESDTQASKTLHTFTINDIYIGGGASPRITIVWKNDAYSGFASDFAKYNAPEDSFFDANFGLESLTLITKAP